MDKFLGTVGLAMRAGKVKCGVFLTGRCVESGEARLVVASEDIGESSRRRIEGICTRFGVPIIYHSTTNELGRSVGKKDVPVVCVCDDNFAKAISLKGKEGLPNE